KLVIWCDCHSPTHQLTNSPTHQFTNSRALPLTTSGEASKLRHRERSRTTRPARSADMKTRPIAMFFACCGLLLGPAAAPAQVRIAGAIAGTVADGTGLAVPRAEAQLKDELTGTQKRVTSNGSGSFTFPYLNFGSYEVTVT